LLHHSVDVFRFSAVNFPSETVDMVESWLGVEPEVRSFAVALLVVCPINFSRRISMQFAAKEQ